MNGFIMMNDLVSLNDREPGVWIVTDINEAEFGHQTGWKRRLTLDALSGQGETSCDEQHVTLIISDKDLMKRRKTINDLPDPRAKLFG